MKGRTRSTAEKQWHDQLANHIGCIACLKDFGVRNTHVSIHHIDGRTKPDAHWLVLALCAGHHQIGTGAPGQLAIHGNKRAHEQRYGTELEQLAQAVNDLVEMGQPIPDRVAELVGLDTTKVCAECEGDCMVQLPSTNQKICNDCKRTVPWPLAAGQKPTYQPSRANRKAISV